MSERDASADAHDITLDATFNTCDLGGYSTGANETVRWRRVIRSDSLARATSADVERLRQLGVGLVIDLRNRVEIDEYGRAPTELFDAEYAHCPVLGQTWSAHDHAQSGTSDGEFLASRYVRMVEHGLPEILRVFELIASAERTVVMQCAVGKDRTGAVTALLLGMLGVNDSDVVADYVRSEAAAVRLARVVEMNGSDASVKPPVPDALFVAPPSAIIGFFDVLRFDHESVCAALVARGADPELAPTLRRALLE